MLLAQDTTRLSLLFLGDIMQHDSQISDAYDAATGRYDYHPCFQYVKPYIQVADLSIGNLELTLAGPPYRGYPQFSAPDELLFALKDMGMDALVTANNHCVDTGQKGLERTIQMLDSLHIPHTGTFTDEAARLNDYPLMLNKNGFSLALLNYTFSTNGLPVTKPNIVNRIDTTVMATDLARAKERKPDAIIVFLHWGVEYQSLPAKTQIDVTEFCFRHGVQLVIGAHPHVIQPMEWREEKNQLVTYSLGNFVSGQRKRYTDGGSMINVVLRKIFAPADTVTTIDSASYVLEWVQRQAGNYYVLPVPSFEKDSAAIALKGESEEAFRVFVEDSRALLGKHNVNIAEAKQEVVAPVIRYKVLLGTQPRDSVNASLSKLLHGMESENDAAGNTLRFSGIFSSRAEAERYRERLVREGYAEAKVVEFNNDVRKE
jgi:poly-gamma-glutamate synthesis protein (capsule biosynthesis protein)